MTVDILGYVYASLVAAGGVFGYVKAASIPSLSAGLGFGAILGVGAFLNSHDPPRPHLQLGTALALGGLMGYRFYNSGKFMPAGLIFILSTGMVIRSAIVYGRYLPFWRSYSATNTTEIND